MNWAGIFYGESVEEEEMYMLATVFTAWMRKRTKNSEDEPAPIPDGKRPKRFAKKRG